MLGRCPLLPGPPPGPTLTDTALPAVLAAQGVPGLVDVHTHFMPQNVLAKVWAFFDGVGSRTGRPWPITYRTSEPERLATLRSLGVTAFAPLAYPHRPGMARWLNEWLRDFAARTPDAVPTATFYAEIDAPQYVEEALEAGLRCVKVHVQVGGFDPRDPLLDDVWGLLAQAGVPVVTHCGDGPHRGEHTGLGVFAEVLARHRSSSPSSPTPGCRTTPRPSTSCTATRACTSTRRWSGPRSRRPSRRSRRTGRPGSSTSPTGSCSAPTSRTSPTRTPSRSRRSPRWADADPRWATPFLRAVLHDTGARLLGL